ncbi:MAG: deoxyribose-phosphate aldolase [Alphaproteobacteria bacterium]
MTPKADVHQLKTGEADGHGHDLARPPITRLDLDQVLSFRANLSAIERRAATLPARRAVKKDYQAAWYLKGISCIDLTTLSGDDSPAKVRRLCAKAKRPVRPEILEAIGWDRPLTVGAVCVYHEMLPHAVKALEGTNIPIAAVSAGFPHGLSPLKQRLEEIRASVEAGATEIDIVISRHQVLRGDWSQLFDEIAAMRDACGDAHLKSILGTGDLATLRNVGRASMVAMQAGSDFIKTSTGKESVNATLPVSLVMLRAIRAYHQATGHMVGYKPAGGIGQAKQVLQYLARMKDELGRRWLEPDLFRFGASSLLGDLERQLEHHATGKYSVAYRHPIS